MINMRDLMIANINERLHKAEAKNNDHFNDLLVYIDDIISEYESEHA